MNFTEYLGYLEKVKVGGNTWSRKDILAKYNIIDEIDTFLTWSIDTAGAWILIDPVEELIVTSPGFPGAYIDFETLMVSTNVQPLLSHRSEQGKKLLHSPAARRYLSPANPNGTYSFPCQSPFYKVQILGGGCLVQYGKGVVSSYLSRASSFDESDRLSFEDAMLETASRCTDPVTLMFSGGKDLLAIYLALAEASTEDFSAVYVKQDGLVSGGSLSQARHVASEYGVTLNLVDPEGGWAFGDSATWNRLHDLLTTTLVNPVAPHHSLAQEPKRLFLSGQNMDVMLSMDMPKPPQSYPPLGNIMWWARHIISHLPKSIRYTDRFFRSKTFRRVVRATEKAIKRGLSEVGRVKREETPPLRDTSFRGILKSLISKELPGSAKCETKLYEEAERIEKLVPKKDVYEGWFHAYPKISSLFLNAEKSVYSFANQGVMYDIWSKKKGLKDAIVPKKNLVKFIKEKGGKKYSKVLNNLKDDRKEEVPNLRVMKRYKKNV